MLRFSFRFSFRFSWERSSQLNLNLRRLGVGEVRSPKPLSGALPKLSSSGGTLGWEGGGWVESRE